MKRADELRRDHAAAVDRISKIGRPERHFSPVSHGGLTTVTVKTTIGYQESSGSKNYWDDEKFDFALAVVIKRQFSTLAAEALLLMKNEADKALVSEKTELLARLDQIAAIENGSAA
ncbi:MAG: hypothetical protein ACRYGA_02150 [Janthinobacterium lividum]